MKSWKSCPKKC